MFCSVSVHGFGALGNGFGVGIGVRVIYPVHDVCWNRFLSLFTCRQFIVRAWKCKK
jgi:hypothetical protein